MRTWRCLKKTLIPNHKLLSEDNINSGQRIYAETCEVFFYISGDWGISQGRIHTKYVGGGTVGTSICEVATCVGSNGRKTPQLMKPIGHQRVMYSTSEGCKNSDSVVWESESVLGKDYIVHYHPTFRVYSSADEQFVIGNH